MKSVVVVIAALAILLPDASGQIDRSRILEETNVAFLRRFAIQKQIEFSQKKDRADSIALLKNWPLRFYSADSSLLEIVDVDLDGRPIYNITDNEEAASTTRADKVHNGGGAGLNLEGQGMTVGIWDGGGVRTSHEQFSGRATQVDVSSNANHATHVAGTMIADGVPNPSSGAKGMAPQANLLAYNWTNDESEMAAAAADGLLISNHSYGTATGWLSSGGTWYWYGNSSYSTDEAHYFGKYEYSARDWDEISENAPYYLIVKSAGNDRNDYSPASGTDYVIPGEGNFNTSSDPRPTDCNEGEGFDCLPTRSSAKNIMVVAAVGDVLNYTGPSSVSMTSFSGWGPTDDGRIKPDIAANGSSLYSSGKNSDSYYYSASGTSMSSPNIAGSCILLQQHYEDVHGTGNFMRSSTLRALVCHTADECGDATGPDYKFGWGLMNTEKAALHISNDADFDDAIIEFELMESDTFNISFQADGSLPFRATIAWTDPAAVATGSGNDNPDSKLINDLDLRIRNQSQTEFLPYALDPANPGAAPTNGDNFRDNIEQIYLANPADGIYTISVSHKGSLEGTSQYFSLILSGSITNPCSQDTIDLTGIPIISQGLYKASECVLVDGELEDQVEFQAGSTILLNAGFTIQANKGFQAEISSCIFMPILPLSLPTPIPAPNTKPLIPISNLAPLPYLREMEG